MSPSVIKSRQNPLVARYRAAARSEGDLVLLDGAHLVSDALSAGIDIRHLAVTPAAQERREVASLVTLLTRTHTDIAIVSDSVMDALSPVRSSSGIVALATRRTSTL